MSSTRQNLEAIHRRMLTLGCMTLGLAFSGCGGGIKDDSNGESERLICPRACIPSSTLATDQMRPSFVVVSDGVRVQAQAGFSSGSDPRFNVEVDGSDSLRLATTQGVQGFHIPASSLSTILVDALQTLVVGATAYLSEVPPSQGTAPVQFQFIRGGTVLVSSVALPAQYQIANPPSGTTLPVSTRTLPIQLTSAEAATVHSASLSCTDVNGNTASGAPLLSIVQNSQSRDSTGISYALNIGEAIDNLAFSTTHPRGAVARCDLGLKVIMQAQGQPDLRFGNAQIFAQQIRSAALALR